MCIYIRMHIYVSHGTPSRGWLFGSPAARSGMRFDRLQLQLQGGVSAEELLKECHEGSPLPLQLFVQGTD